MLNFSMSSVLMSVLFSNVLLIVMYLIFRNTRLMLKIGYRLLAVFLAITLLRFAFPFELRFLSTNIYWPESVSYMITTIFLVPHIALGNVKLSLWQVLLAVWGIGTFIQCCRLIGSYRLLHRKILLFGTNITAEEPYASLLDKICQERGRQNRFRIFTLPGITTPMVYGLKSPYILLPEKLSLDAEELYYVLCHEASHFFQHDLWLKLFSQILQAVFWWNPFSFLLKRQISLMLELRTDRYVSNDSLHREAYAQTLLQMAKLQIHQDLRPTISFCDVSGSALSQRILMLIRSPDKTRRRPVQLLFSFLIVGLYAFSLFFIFEPHSINKDDATGTLEISSETSYLIENPNGGYDLYYNDIFLETYPVLDDYLPKLKIYKTLEEVKHD